jgi:hypothetical protein
MENLYKVYFYSSPNFLILKYDDIIDINLVERGKNKIKKIEIIYSDDFFDFNIKKTKSKDWSLTVQIFNIDKTFQLQLDLHGEDLKFSQRKLGKVLSFTYEQITNNNGWASLPKVFENAEVDYDQYKRSFIRNEKLKQLI